MKTSVVQCYNQKYAEVGDLTKEITRQYCFRQGYQYEQWYPIDDIDIRWQKLDAISYVMSKSTTDDVVIWLDSDILIRDPSMILTKTTYPMLVSQDFNGINDGVIVFKINKWVEQLMDVWKFLGNVEGATHLQQDTLKLMMKCPNVSKYIGRIPENVIANEMSSEADKSACYAYHYWAGGINERMISTIEKVKQFMDNGKFIV